MTGSRGALRVALGGVPGLRLAPVRPDTVSNFWVYPVALDPAQTDMTSKEFSQLCQQEHGVGPGVYSEVNYLEVVYQQMNQQRHTSVGYPLPDYVRYEPGICPQAEDGAKRMIPLGVHHGTDPESLRTTMQAIAQTACQHL